MQFTRADDGVESHGEEWQVQFVCQRMGRKALAASWWSVEE